MSKLSSFSFTHNKSININYKIATFICLTLLMIMLFSFYSVTIPTNIVKAKTVDTANDTIHLKAGYLNYMKDKIELDKGINIVKGKLQLNALQGELYRDEMKVILSDNINMTSNNIKVTSNKLNVFFEQDRYLFEDNVNLKYYLGKENLDVGRVKNQDNDILILKTSQLEFDKSSKSFEAENGVEIEFKQKQVRADKADYDEEKKELTVSGNVLIKEKNGDWLRGNKAVFNLESGQEEFSLDGDVELELNF